jgi:hypothetical protein
MGRKSFQTEEQEQELSQYLKENLYQCSQEISIAKKLRHEDTQRFERVASSSLFYLSQTQSGYCKTSERKSDKGEKNQRKIGVQKGHPKHDRIPFAEAQIDTIITHELVQCPNVRGEMGRPLIGRGERDVSFDSSQRGIVVTELVA